MNYLNVQCATCLEPFSRMTGLFDRALPSDPIHRAACIELVTHQLVLVFTNSSMTLLMRAIAPFDFGMKVAQSFLRSEWIEAHAGHVWKVVDDTNQELHLGQKLPKR